MKVVITKKSKKCIYKLLMMLLKWKNTTRTRFCNLQFRCIKEVQHFIVLKRCIKAAAIWMDWSENAKLLQCWQEKSAYYYDIQVSVNMAVVYEANKSTTFVGSLSDNTNHKKTAVRASLKSMIDVINLDVINLKFISDNRQSIKPVQKCWLCFSGQKICRKK